MMHYNKRQARIRRMRRWRDYALERVAWIVVYGIFLYLFVWLPLARSMGW